MRRHHRLIEEDTPITLSDTATAQLSETFRADGGAELIRAVIMEDYVAGVSSARAEILILVGRWGGRRRGRAGLELFR